MKNKIPILVVLFMLILMPSAYAIETKGSFSCLIQFGALEYGYYGVLSQDPAWVDRISSLQLQGNTCPLYSYTPEFGTVLIYFMTRLSIPEDFKFVSSDGSVLGDEVCAGEKFRLQKGINKGEFWQEGGDSDSPPIHWVDDVPELVYSLVKRKADTCSQYEPSYPRTPFRRLFNLPAFYGSMNDTLVTNKEQQERFRQYLKELGYDKVSEELVDAEYSPAEETGPQDYRKYYYPIPVSARKDGKEIARIAMYMRDFTSFNITDNLPRSFVVSIEADGQTIAYWPIEVSGGSDRFVVYADDVVRKNGEIDPVTGIPIYRFYNWGTAYHVDVGVACSMQERDSSAQGLNTDAAGWYSPTTKDTAEYRASYDILCTYYFYGAGLSSPPSSFPSLNITTAPYYLLIQMPSIRNELYGYGSGGGLGGYYPGYQGSPFTVGSISVNKSFKVVSPANPKVDISVSGANKLALNQPNVLRVLVRNSGDVDVDLSDVRSNAVYKFVSCDAKTVKPGETKECLIEITPQVGEGVSVNVNYGYRTCGKSMKGVASKEILSSQVVKASSMSQVYALDVSGGCVNRYYVCNSALEQQWFSLGYKCSTKEANKYLVSSMERIDLGFGLPAMPEGATVAGARLGLTSSGANKAQDVSVYSVSGWSQAFCVPGGDICAKPSCEECAPLFDLSGQQLGTTNVPGPGKYYIDVTDEVKKAYQNKDAKVFLQLRGKEDYSADTSSCGAGKDWTRYDLNFRGKTDAPYLEIVYAK